MLSRKWAIFLVLTGMYVVAYFYRVSAAVIAGDLTADLALSPQELGNVSAALFYAFALAQLPLGPLLDRFSPRIIISALGLITALGALIFSRSAGFGEAMAGRALIGLGTACVLMGSLKIYTTLFPSRQFATMAGLQVALGNFGNLLATAPLAWLAKTIGWRGTFAAAALLTISGAIAVLVFVRDTKDKKVAGDRPWLAGWKDVVRVPSFWGLAALAFFWYGGYMAVQGLWGPLYLMEVLGLDRGGAARLLFFTAIGFIFGCPLAGRLSDRILVSRKKVLLPGQLGLLLLLALFLGPLETLPVALRPIVFFLFGLCVSTGPVLYAQAKELFPGNLSATAMTAVNFFVVIGAALIQQIMGKVIAIKSAGSGGMSADTFHAAFAVPVIGMGVAWVVFLFCRDTRPR